jgi:hypothetical protein
MKILAVDDWWLALNGPEKFFWIIALVFSALFIIQFILSMIGADFDSDVDTDFDIDSPAELELEADLDLEADFTVFSFRGILAFFCFFGWTGVLSLNAGLGTIVAGIIATLAGLAAMFIVAYMLFKFQQLEVSTTMHIEEAVGKEADVYLEIPALNEGVGKIMLDVGGNLRELEAISASGSIPTGSKVTVIDIMKDNVLVVELIPELPEQAGTEMKN